MSDYAADRPDVLADLLMDAAPPQFSVLFPKAQAVATQALTVLESELVGKPTPEATKTTGISSPSARRGQRLLGQAGRAEEVWPLLRHSATPAPQLHRELAHPSGCRPSHSCRRTDRLPATAKPTPAPGQQFMDAVLFHPETSMRRALILALGTYGKDGLSPGEREPLIGKLLDLYATTLTPESTARRNGRCGSGRMKRN